jgi:hypothetical protein
MVVLRILSGNSKVGQYFAPPLIKLGSIPVYILTQKITVISPQYIYKSDIIHPKIKYITETCSVSRFEQVFYICNIK